MSDVSRAARGMSAFVDDRRQYLASKREMGAAVREDEWCKCGWPEKDCLRRVLRNGPPFPPEPCEPRANLLSLTMSDDPFQTLGDVLDTMRANNMQRAAAFVEWLAIEGEYQRLALIASDQAVGKNEQ